MTPPTDSKEGSPYPSKAQEVLTLGTAHDLNGVAMTLQLVRDELAENLGEIAAELAASVERVKRAVDELRGLSNPWTEPRRVFELNALVSGLHQGLNRVSGIGDRLVFDLTDNATHIAERTTLLKLGLLELLSLASAALPEGRELTICTRQLSASERASSAAEWLDARDHILLGMHETGEARWTDCRPHSFDGSEGKPRELRHIEHVDGIVLWEDPLAAPQVWLAVPAVAAPKP